MKIRPKDRLVDGWARLFPNPRYYGWAIVGLCFLACALSSPGQSFAISLYVDEVIEALDVSRLEVSSLYGVMTLLAAGCLPFVGRIADAMTARRFLASNLLLLALAIAFFAVVQNLWMLAAAFFLLRLLGQGAIGLGTLTATVVWFRRYRGRALGVGQLGYAFGELIFPATIVALIAVVGWRQSLWVIAAVYIVVFVPLYLWLLRERRNDEPLDGEARPLPEAIDSSREEDRFGQSSFEVNEALKTPVFWGMLACVAVLPMVITAVIFHQVALFEAVGWGADHVPISFVFFAITSVSTTYVSSILLERIPCRFGVTAGMLAAVLAMVVAYWAGPPLVGSLMYGTVLGASAGIITAANALVWPEYFGVGSIGAIKGVVNAVRNGSTALGPPLVAWLIGPEIDFTNAFWLLGALSLAAAVAAVWMTPPEDNS